ncbi:unnamed protein product [Clavelina lepadiformis]|uniref:Uncharacterized protein n=1 Tax=Clavelina lepadiformis TaxID=159417 RepID=A0ABP0F6G6_CLALP
MFDKTNLATLPDAANCDVGMTSTQQNRSHFLPNNPTMQAAMVSVLEYYQLHRLGAASAAENQNRPPTIAVRNEGKFVNTAANDVPRAAEKSNQLDADLMASNVFSQTLPANSDVNAFVDASKNASPTAQNLFLPSVFPTLPYLFSQSLRDVNKITTNNNVTCPRRSFNTNGASDNIYLPTGVLTPPDFFPAPLPPTAVNSKRKKKSPTVKASKQKRGKHVTKTKPRQTSKCKQATASNAKYPVNPSSNEADHALDLRLPKRSSHNHDVTGRAASSPNYKPSTPITARCQQVQPMKTSTQAMPAQILPQSQGNNGLKKLQPTGNVHQLIRPITPKSTDTSHKAPSPSSSFSNGPSSSLPFPTYPISTNDVTLFSKQIPMTSAEALPMKLPNRPITDHVVQSTNCFKNVQYSADTVSNSSPSVRRDGRYTENTSHTAPPVGKVLVQPRSSVPVKVNKSVGTSSTSASGASAAVSFKMQPVSQVSKSTHKNSTTEPYTVIVNVPNKANTVSITVPANLPKKILDSPRCTAQSPTHHDDVITTSSYSKCPVENEEIESDDCDVPVIVNYYSLVKQKTPVVIKTESNRDTSSTPLVCSVNDAKNRGSKSGKSFDSTAVIRPASVKQESVSDSFRDFLKNTILPETNLSSIEERDQPSASKFNQCNPVTVKQEPQSPSPKIQRNCISSAGSAAKPHRTPIKNIFEIFESLQTDEDPSTETCVELKKEPLYSDENVLPRLENSSNTISSLASQLSSANKRRGAGITQFRKRARISISRNYKRPKIELIYKRSLSRVSVVPKEIKANDVIGYSPFGGIPTVTIPSQKVFVRTNEIAILKKILATKCRVSVDDLNLIPV